MIITVVLFGGSASGEFFDISGHWAERSIEKWSETYSIIRGANGNFRPDDNITRAEMATILARLLGYETTAENTFSDIAGDEWYADAVLKAGAAGVIKGSSGRMRPLDNVTRQEAAVMLARALGIEEEDGKLSYTDKADIADWAKGHICAMTKRGYVNGSGGKFRPKGNLTRAEAVTMIDNIISEIIYSPGTYTENIDGTVIIMSKKPLSLSGISVFGDVIISEGAGKVVLAGSEVLGKIQNHSKTDVIIREEKAPDVIEYGSHVVPLIKNVAVNAYDPEGFFVGEDGAKYYSANGEVGIKGVDVSAHQEDIDWDKVRASGVEFAMIRIGYRGYTVGSLNLDKYFEQNIKGAKKAGIKVGVYFFSQAITEEEARNEARFVLINLEGYDLDYPVVFDWESVSSKNARTRDADVETVVSCALAFCDEVESAGYMPMIYFNSYDGLLRYDLGRLSQYDFWFAGYTSAPRLYYDFSIWQYTSSGSVDGIEGRADMDIAFKDYSKIKK